MNVCLRSECQTTAGCAHRGPHLELCWFPQPSNQRNDIIEECARVAASFHAYEIADAIRALKDKQ